MRCPALVGVVLSIVLSGTPVAFSLSTQESKPPPKPAEPPSESGKKERITSERDPTADPEREMMARAAIALRESEFRRAVTASEQILKHARTLQEKAASGRPLGSSENLLAEIEKLAKRIKSVSGAASLDDDEPLPESPPQVIEELQRAAEALHQGMKKLNAYAISVDVITRAETILRLCRALRQMIRSESGSSARPRPSPSS